MGMPAGFDPHNPQCPKCHGAMCNNIGSPKRGKGPHFRCKNKACKTGDYGTGVFLSDDEEAAYNANGAAPQGQKQAPQAQASPRQQVGFDTALNAGCEAITTIGDALAATAKAQGLDLSNPTVQAGWFAAVSSVACSFVIAVSDGRLRLGPEPEPAKPETAMDRHKRAIATAQDKAACLRCMAAFTADDTLFPNEKSDLDLLADAKLDALKAADKAEGGMLSN